MPFFLAGHIEIGELEAIELLDGYPDLTLRLYDGGADSGPDAVGVTEIGRLVVIEPLDQSVALSLLEASDGAQWGLVPLDARLADADPEGDLYWDATALYHHFTSIDGVGPAIASKLLHMKRPCFFPVLDSRLRDVYEEQARCAYSQSQRGQEKFPAWDRLFWAAIRKDLNLDTNISALRHLRAILRQSGTERHQALAGLSDVRLLDMLVWQHSASAGGSS